MLTINLVFILRKSVNYSVNLFSNRNMNSANDDDDDDDDDSDNDDNSNKTIFMVPSS